MHERLLLSSVLTETVWIDLLESQPSTSNWKQYPLDVTDCFSKLSRGSPVSNTTAPKESYRAIGCSPDKNAEERSDRNQFLTTYITIGILGATYKTLERSIQSILSRSNNTEQTTTIHWWHAAAFIPGTSRCTRKLRKMSHGTRHFPYMYAEATMQHCERHSGLRC